MRVGGRCLLLDVSHLKAYATHVRVCPTPVVFASLCVRLLMCICLLVFIQFLVSKLFASSCGSTSSRVSTSVAVTCAYCGYNRISEASTDVTIRLGRETKASPPLCIPLLLMCTPHPTQRRPSSIFICPSRE